MSGDRDRPGRFVNSSSWALLGATFLACQSPGVRAKGTAEVVIGGATEVRWSGSCSYSVQTKWSAQLNHILRLDDDSSRSAVVIQDRRAWRPGTRDFPTGDERDLLGLVMDGSTVDGGLLGSIEITRAGDSLFAMVRGMIDGRDSRPIEASCRVGPPAPVR